MLSEMVGVSHLRGRYILLLLRGAMRWAPNLSSHAQIPICDSKRCCENSLYQLVLAISFLTNPALSWVWEAEPLSFLCSLPRQSATHIPALPSVWHIIPLNARFDVQGQGCWHTCSVCPSWSTATIYNHFTSLGYYRNAFPRGYSPSSTQPEVQNRQGKQLAWNHS